MVDIGHLLMELHDELDNPVQILENSQISPCSGVVVHCIYILK